MIQDELNGLQCYIAPASKYRASFLRVVEHSSKIRESVRSLLVKIEMVVLNSAQHNLDRLINCNLHSKEVWGRNSLSCERDAIVKRNNSTL